jgi:hypothetical protein
MRTEWDPHVKTGGAKHMYSVGFPYDRTDVTKPVYRMGSLREDRWDQTCVTVWGFLMIRTVSNVLNTGIKCWPI